MPLLDHFHEPLDPQRVWESFHSRWATAIANHLDRTLPRRFFALVQIHRGSRIEADVAEFERANGLEEEPTGNGQAGGGVAVQTWAPPATTMVMPAIFPDDLEIQVIDRDDSYRLVAVVELVSLSNKDRPDNRHSFAAKCAAYLRRGVGLVIADVVTTRQFNLHNELVRTLDLGTEFHMPDAASLYAVGYRPIRRGENNQIDVWALPLAVGRSLPVVPLALLGAETIPLDLEATYMEVRRNSRL